MKLLIFGMEPCIHCRQAKAFLDAENIPYMFFDITESTANMKKFLKLRDTEPLFDDVKKEGRIGVPCFKLSDVTLTLNLNEALEKMGVEARYTQEVQC